MQRVAALETLFLDKNEASWIFLIPYINAYIFLSEQKAFKFLLEKVQGRRLANFFLRSEAVHSVATSKTLFLDVNEYF